MERKPLRKVVRKRLLKRGKTARRRLEFFGIAGQFVRPIDPDRVIPYWINWFRSEEVRDRSYASALKAARMTLPEWTSSYWRVTRDDVEFVERRLHAQTGSKG